MAGRRAATRGLTRGAKPRMAATVDYLFAFAATTGKAGRGPIFRRQIYRAYVGRRSGVRRIRTPGRLSAAGSAEIARRARPRRSARPCGWPRRNAGGGRSACQRPDRGGRVASPGGPSRGRGIGRGRNAPEPEARPTARRKWGPQGRGARQAPLATKDEGSAACCFHTGPRAMGTVDGGFGAGDAHRSATGDTSASCSSSRRVEAVGERGRARALPRPVDASKILGRRAQPWDTQEFASANPGRRRAPKHGTAKAIAWARSALSTWLILDELNNRAGATTTCRLRGRDLDAPERRRRPDLHRRRHRAANAKPELIRARRPRPPT